MPRSSEPNPASERSGVNVAWGNEAAETAVLVDYRDCMCVYYQLIFNCVGCVWRTAVLVVKKLFSSKGFKSAMTR